MSEILGVVVAVILVAMVFIPGRWVPSDDAGHLTSGGSLMLTLVSAMAAAATYAALPTIVEVLA